ncbi:hypothetical protein ACWDNI_35720 [Nocardia niigatensis]
MTDDDIRERIPVVIARDIETDFGVIRKGTTMFARPSFRRGWDLEVAPPLVNRGSEYTLPVRIRVVEGGQGLLMRLHARYDYRFAREVIGMSHHAACKWILTGYGVTDRQLSRWGLTLNPKEDAA